MPLKQAQIDQFDTKGYLAPLDLISKDTVITLKQAVVEHINSEVDSERYELTDEFVIKPKNTHGGSTILEYTKGGESKDLHSLPFLINVWRNDERFKSVGFNPQIAELAAQLLRTDRVLLMEDNVIVKNAGARSIPWHQDFSYWPLQQPDAVTLWIALDRITYSNGGMQIVPGSHLTGEHLPVWFRDGKAFLYEERKLPSVPQNPSELGFEVINYDLKPGQGGFHDAMVWHGSPPNKTDRARMVFVLRYVKFGSVWLGDERMPYDDIGCQVGDRLTEAHFPLVGDFR